MDEKCPTTLFSGGSVSTSAGGTACCATVVAAGVVVGVGARKFGMGMVGTPAQAVRIRLIRSKQFRVGRKRCLIIWKPSNKKNDPSLSHYTLVEDVIARSRVAATW